MATSRQVAIAAGNKPTPGPRGGAVGGLTDVGVVHPWTSGEERAATLFAIDWAFRGHECDLVLYPDRRWYMCQTPGHAGRVAVARDLLAMLFERPRRTPLKVGAGLPPAGTDGLA